MDAKLIFIFWLGIKSLALSLGEISVKTKYFSSNIDAFKTALKPILNESFESVLSFGSCCLTKYRILSFCKQNPEVKNSNHLFDWMVPLNYTALGEAIKNEFKDVFGTNFLTVKHEYSLQVLYNYKYQLVFNHAFDGIKEVSTRENHNLLTTDSFLKYYHLIEKKFKYLTNNSKYAILNTKKTLYIVYATNYPSKPNGQKQADFFSLMHSIKSKRNDRFLLLVMVTDTLSSINTYEFDVLLEGNLIFHQIKHFSMFFWHCEESIQEWNEILELFFIKS